MMACLDQIVASDLLQLDILLMIQFSGLSHVDYKSLARAIKSLDCFIKR